MQQLRCRVQSFSERPGPTSDGTIVFMRDYLSITRALILLSSVATGQTLLVKQSVEDSEYPIENSSRYVCLYNNNSYIGNHFHPNIEKRGHDSKSDFMVIGYSDWWLVKTKVTENNRGCNKGGHDSHGGVRSRGGENCGNIQQQNPSALLA
ncbi:hypothetical protein M9H77_06827 [Catharanthus roseus]|uniref:Uncharacterized protein n=1 Tax=Catharanthus roseus TaxID=4058 RepID=A0ACC0BT72_CATRO|nr:hypothetical protein M9H77_06827 [Catharanthus roseus]